MQNKIAIVTSGHPAFDERIFWKFGLSLAQNNYLVRIICSTEENNNEKENISIIGFESKSINKIQKIKIFFESLESFSPDIIICCESLTIVPALKFKFLKKRSVKIIYDVTEWYPEGIVSKIKGSKKILVYFFLFMLNIVLANLTSAIIVGETSKLKRYKLFAPFKNKIIIGYYPVIKFFDYNAPPYDGRTLVLCYAGLINFKRGIKGLIQTSSHLAERHRDKKIILKIVGKFESEEDEKAFDSLSCGFDNILIDKAGWTEYKNISSLLRDVDICFDLRERNFIYNHSLPIKIFEYMACGKPFIFSDVEPIRKEFGEINCGFLVNPNDAEDIINKIELYLSDTELLKQHSRNGRQIIESGKNWEVESQKLLKLIDNLIKRK